MLKIYNSLTRQKEVFQPIRAGLLGVSFCVLTMFCLC